MKGFNQGSTKVLCRLLLCMFFLVGFSNVGVSQDTSQKTEVGNNPGLGMDSNIWALKSPKAEYHKSVTLIVVYPTVSTTPAPVPAPPSFEYPAQNHQFSNPVPSYSPSVPIQIENYQPSLPAPNYLPSVPIQNYQSSPPANSYPSYSYPQDGVPFVGTTGGGSGSGVLIDKDKGDGYGYVLSAMHVFDGIYADIEITFHSGEKTKDCKVVQSNKQDDLALLRVRLPRKYTASPVATKNVKVGDKIEYVGVGGSNDLINGLRSFFGFASAPSTKRKIFSDESLIPGDSGGGVFNENHEVVGTISGGWFWYFPDLKTKKGRPVKITWPARTSNTAAIMDLLKLEGLSN